MLGWIKQMNGWMNELMLSGSFLGKKRCVRYGKMNEWMNECRVKNPLNEYCVVVLNIALKCIKINHRGWKDD